MQRVLTTLLFLFLWPHAFAHAEEKWPSSVCTQIPSEKKRLRCYDDFHKSKSLPPPVEAQGWKINIGRSEGDGSARVVIRTRDMSESGSDPQFLYVACRRLKTTIWVTTPNTISNEKTIIPVHVRLDGAPVSDVNFYRSYNGLSLGIWKDSLARDFIRDLLKGKTLAIHAKEQGSKFPKLEFDITDMRRALNPVARTCRWNIKHS